jgi:uncharacterized repeat protein (TIGR01451 family)
MSSFFNPIRCLFGIGPLLWVLSLSGCAALTVPAIDPTGERIFLPCPNYTTLASCDDQLLTGVCFPRAAFAEPPPVPVCPERVAPPVIAFPGGQAAPGCGQPHPVGPALGTGVAPAPSVPAANQQDRLLLTPAKIVAPVGTEVVLVAGICGPNGYYVTKQPIEWLLSQDSVGNFIDQSKGRHNRMTSLLSPHPSRKFSSNYAITQSSTATQRINRGTTKLEDDVLVQKGQTWLTVTSATEGVSYVTAVATGAENWEQRRQLATIHWVDAQWTLPTNAIVRAGEQVALTTKITRPSNGLGASRWLVRYEIAAGPQVVFAANGQTTIDISTEESGEATAVLAPRSIEPGLTQVRVRIFTPGNASGGDDRVPVGQGFTTVTWSAPGLKLQSAGPAVVAAGSTFGYRTVVSNPGDMAATNVVVIAEIPQFMQYVSANPPPTQVVGNQVRWQFNSLPPLESATLEISVRAASAGDQRLRIRAESSEGLRTEESVATSVVQSSLQLRLVDPPVTAVAGQRVQFNIELTNTGDLPLRNVTLRDRFDSGLQHTGGERSPIEKLVGEIEARGVRRIGVSFYVRQAGRLCHTLEASADGGHGVSAEACVVAREPAYEVSVRVTGPPQRSVGEIALYEIAVTNTGEAAVTRVRLVGVVKPTLQATSITTGGMLDNEGFAWEIPSLAPGQTEVRRIQATCIGVDPQAEVSARVTCDQGIRANGFAVTQILAATRPPTIGTSATARPFLPDEEDESDSAGDLAERPSEASSADSKPLSDQLLVTVKETEDPIAIGKGTTYIIELHNDRDLSDRNIQVYCKLPKGLRFERFVSVSARLAVQVSSDRREIEIEPIAEMRPGGRRVFRIEVTSTASGNLPLEVVVRSQRSKEPLRIVEMTRVR